MLTPGKAGLLIHKTQVILAQLLGMRTNTKEKSKTKNKNILG